MIQIQIPDIRHRSQEQQTCIGFGIGIWIGRNWNLLKILSTYKAISISVCFHLLQYLISIDEFRVQVSVILSL